MTATTDPARTERADTTGTTRSPATTPPDLHNGEGTPCAAASGANGHALRLLDLARRAGQAQANRPAAAREASDTTPGTHAPAPQPPLAALILDAAADLIADHGWCRGMASDFLTGGMCLEYALFRAAHLLGGTTVDVDLILAGIDERLGQPARLWNDAPGRTPGEVVTLLRSRAEEARAA
jgi:hypothetical protein